MILFAVVIGVIETLQYFTQAYVAAAIASGQAASAGDPAQNARAIPRTRRSIYPAPALPAKAFAYFNMGYASAMTMLLLLGRPHGHASSSSAARGSGSSTQVPAGDDGYAAIAPRALEQHGNLQRACGGGVS